MSGNLVNVLRLNRIHGILKMLRDASRRREKLGGERSFDLLAVRVRSGDKEQGIIGVDRVPQCAGSREPAGRLRLPASKNNADALPPSPPQRLQGLVPVRPRAADRGGQLINRDADLRRVPCS